MAVVATTGVIGLIFRWELLDRVTELKDGVVTIICGVASELVWNWEVVKFRWIFRVWPTTRYPESKMVFEAVTKKLSELSIPLHYAYQEQNGLSDRYQYLAEDKSKIQPKKDMARYHRVERKVKRLDRRFWNSHNLAKRQGAYGLPTHYADFLPSHISH